MIFKIVFAFYLYLHFDLYFNLYCFSSNLSKSVDVGADCVCGANDVEGTSPPG